MSALPSILQSDVINGTINRLKVVNDSLQRALGMQVGGPNTTVAPARRSSYDIFDDTREVPTATNAGSESVTIARQSVGTTPYIIPYSHEKLPLKVEELNQLRAIGGPQGSIDALGESYAMRQARILRQRSVNLREFQVAAMLRGSYTYSQTGPDQLVHGFSGGGITVDYQIPAGNKSQLDMLGGGDIIGTAWDNVAAPIITDLWEINAAFIQLTGRGLRKVIVSSVMWGHIIGNTQVKNNSGSSNRVFDVLERNDDDDTYRARLFAMPNVEFHINDNGLSLGGTFTKLIPDTAAVFLSDLDSTVAEYGECPSPVVEGNGQPMNRVGDYYWTKFEDDPVAYNLHRKSDGLPFLYVPKAIAFGTVDF